MNPAEIWCGEPARLSRRHLHDETLRDGLQSPSLVDPPLVDKMRLVRLLARAGVASCCLALPAAGPRAQRDATTLITMIEDENLPIDPVLAGRTCEADVDAILRIAARTSLEVEATLFLGASPIRAWVEGWTLPQLADMIRRSFRRARHGGLRPNLVLEDATRTPPVTLEPLIGTALAEGARRVTLCDTVGVATPAGAAALARWARTIVGPEVGLDWHGHDDRGLALANALAAAEAGCDRIHGCLDGIGERVGNTNLGLLAAELGRRGAGSWEPAHLDAAARCLEAEPARLRLAS